MAPLCQGGLTPATAKSITNIDPARSINVKSITRNSQITWERALTYFLTAGQRDYMLMCIG